MSLRPDLGIIAVSEFEQVSVHILIFFAGIWNSDPKLGEVDGGYLAIACSKLFPIKIRVC